MNALIHNSVITVVTVVREQVCVPQFLHLDAKIRASLTSKPIGFKFSGGYFCFKIAFAAFSWRDGEADSLVPAQVWKKELLKIEKL